MKISDRFTDYGLIGGFFWMLQFALWVFSMNGTWTDVLREIGEPLKLVPSEALSSFVALLGVLGLVIVFITGVLLDLLGSFAFRPYEMMEFIRYARGQGSWFQGLIDRNREYLQEDYSILLSYPSYRSQFRAMWNALKVWSSKDRAEFVRQCRAFFPALRAYTRMHSFLLSGVLLSPGVDKMELLSNQLALWNVSRALAAAICIPAIFESGVLFASSGPLLTPIAWFFEAVALYVVILPYSRVRSTLFALLYITHERDRQGTASPLNESAG